MIDPQLAALGFDAEAYRLQHPDLAHMEPAALGEHLLRHGLGERRVAMFGKTVAAAAAILEDVSWPIATRMAIARTLAATIAFHGPVVVPEAGLADLLTPHWAYRRMIVASDSHGMLYRHPAAFWRTGMLAVPLLCSGGSARGLASPTSRAQNGARILGVLDTARAHLRDVPLLLKFGQVDLEFVYHFGRIRDGRKDYRPADARAYADEVADRYAVFVDMARQAHPGPVAIAGVLPPMLSDATLRVGYVNAHIGFLHSELELDALREALALIEMPDIGERMAVHAYFNARLAGIAEAKAALFVDEYREIVDAAGMVRPQFLVGHDGSDHHMAFGNPACLDLSTRILARLIAC